MNVISRRDDVMPGRARRVLRQVAGLIVVVPLKIARAILHSWPARHPVGVYFAMDVLPACRGMWVHAVLDANALGAYDVFHRTHEVQGCG